MAAAPASHTPAASARQGKAACCWGWLGVIGLSPPWGCPGSGATAAGPSCPTLWAGSPVWGSPWASPGASVWGRAGSFSRMGAGFSCAPLWDTAGRAPSARAWGTAERGLWREKGRSSRAKTMSHSRHTACRGARFFSASRRRKTMPAA